MINSRLRNTIFLLLFILGGYQSAFATHIIGGEINYKCLGNNDYQISLTVYRDCFLGEANLDDTAYVAIYDVANNLVQTLPMLLGTVDTIVQIDECLLIPPNICVETTTYIDTINLLPQAGGYHIAYQRCCRNQTILNIIDPLNTGTTYDIVLTEEAMRTCNSSPILNDWPPTFVCVSRPLVYSRSAFDIDGDSLVYRLCTPLEGGISMTNPRPRPAFPPPYREVRWNTPTYDLNNLLGGIPLKIDAKTGLLTGQPNTIGQFVVGICVDEYRNGQLLSSTRRDFQYNVIPCEDVVADFDLPTSQCANQSVQIDNQTAGEPEGYLWKFFNDNQELLGTSTETSPLFAFPDTGNFIVRLIVNPNSICVDSTDKVIFLQPNTIIADFQYDILGCADSLELQFSDESINTLGTIDSWLWTFDGDIEQFTSIEQHPQITLMNSQNLRVTLQASSEAGCSDEKTWELNAMIIPDSFSVSTFDTLVVCRGDSIELNPIFNPELTYSWSPSTGLNDDTAPNPKAFPDTSIAYVVMIRDSGDNCELRKNVFLEVIDFDNSFDFTVNVLECGDSARIQLIPDPSYNLSEVTLEWEIKQNGQTFFYTNPDPIFVSKSEDSLFISGTVTDRFGCSKTVQKELQVKFITEEIETKFSLCPGDSIELNPVFNPAYTYSWSPSIGLDDNTAANPKAFPEISTTYVVTIRENGNNCELKKTVFVEVNDFDKSFDFDVDILECGDSARIQLTPNPSYDLSQVTLEWEIEQNGQRLIYNTQAPIFILKNEETVTFIGTVSNQIGCSRTVQKELQIELITEEIVTERSFCLGDSVALNPDFNPAYAYSWSPAELFPNPSLPNPVILPTSSAEIKVAINNQIGNCPVERTVNLTLSQTIQSADFEFRITGCSDSITLEITDVTTQPAGFINDIIWDLNGDVENSSSTELTPTFILKNSQFVQLQLHLNPNSSCPKTITKTFRANILEDINLVQDFDICQGESIELNAEAIVPEYIYTWTPNTTLDDGSKANPIATPNQPTTYMVNYTDSTGLCAIEKEVFVNVRNTLPKIDAEVAINCDGRTIQITPSSNAAIDYNFGDNMSITSDTTVLTHQYAIAGIYQLMLQYADASVCPDSTTISIELPEENLSPNFEWNVEACNNNVASLELLDLSKSIFGEITNWDWQLSNGATATEAEPVFQITENEELTAQLIITLDNDAQCRDSLSVIIPPLLIDEDFEDTIIVCAGTTVVLNPTFNPAYNYLWSPKEVIIDATNPNPSLDITESQNFFVQVTNEFDCELSDSIFTDAAPFIDINTIEIPVVCEPSEIVLMAESEQTDNLAWLSADGDTLGFEPELLVDIAEIQTFTAVFTDAFNCQNEATIMVDYQPILLDFESEQPVCFDETKTLIINNLRPESPLKFDWMPTFDIIEGSETISPTVSVEEPTTFTFEAGNEAGCKITGEIFVDKLPLPQIAATADPETIFEGESSQLSATNAVNYAYTWTPENSLDNATIVNPIASPLVTTNYLVNIIDENGCENTASVTVNVREGICDFPYIYVPTGFTPNNDGENDVLFVRGLFIDELTFVIYDRWGDQVFETDNQDIGWDGTKNGEPLPSGVFGYYLRAVCKNGEVYTRQGNVTLVR